MCPACSAGAFAQREPSPNSALIVPERAGFPPTHPHLPSCIILGAFFCWKLQWAVFRFWGIGVWFCGSAVGFSQESRLQVWVALLKCVLFIRPCSVP